MNIKECRQALLNNEIIEYKTTVDVVFESTITLMSRIVLFPVQIISIKLDEYNQTYIKVEMVEQSSVSEKMQQQYKEAFEIRKQLGKRFFLSSLIGENIPTLQRRNS